MATRVSMDAAPASHQQHASSSAQSQQQPQQNGSHAPSHLPARSARRRLPSGERIWGESRRIDALVMSLEDVLYDHTNLLAHFAIDRAIQQLVAEKAFPHVVAAYEALQTFRHAFGYRKRFPRFVDSLMAQHIVTSEAAQRVIAAYYESQVAEARTIRPFENAKKTLETLQAAGYHLGLICVGKQDVQLERLYTLQLEGFFSEIVFVPSNPCVAQLVQAMKEIGRRFMLQPSSMLFLGRKVFYEIKAANKVGLVTVRMVYGKYRSVMPIEKLEQPDYQITSIDQLPAIVQLADQQLIRPKIVALGGGTGLAVLLNELRHYPADLTAIVTVFDSGRHSGALRKYLGILPPGDIRNCLVALSDSDEVMHQLMNYRFKENFMEGCSLGNLLLAALTDIQGGFEKAVTSVGDILNIHGNVLPATLDSTELCAELEDGSVVVSEVNVRSPTIETPDGTKQKKPRIKRVFLQDDNVQAFRPAVRAIEDADIILISPGGFYTSIISTLLVPGIRDAIRQSRGATVYIANVATQTGQTDGMTLSDTLQELYRYLGDNTIDYMVANNVIPSRDAMASFFSTGEKLLLPTEDLVNVARPMLLQGKTFEDIDATDGDGQPWDKARMIKHSGKMVAAMLYRIIDKEVAAMRASAMQFARRPPTPSSAMQRHPRPQRESTSTKSNRAGTLIASGLLLATIVVTVVIKTRLLARSSN